MPIKVLNYQWPHLVLLKEVFVVIWVVRMLFVCRLLITLIILCYDSNLLMTEKVLVTFWMTIIFSLVLRKINSKKICFFCPFFLIKENILYQCCSYNLPKINLCFHDVDINWRLKIFHFLGRSIRKVCVVVWILIECCWMNNLTGWDALRCCRFQWVRSRTKWWRSMQSR